MITIILLLLFIFIPSFYIGVKKNIDIEKIIPCTIFSIILIIYIFGLINLLKLGVFAVYLVFIITTFLLIVDILKHKLILKNKLKVLLKPSIIIWIVGIFLMYFYYKGRMLVAWDEFSHWGDVVKMMYYNNIYNTNAASLSAARAYPPIMSIFQYFVENLSFVGFKEHFLFCAYHIVVISLILPFIKNIKWKELIKIILTILIVILAPTVFFSNAYYYYNIIYIDPFLGILFGYMMASIFLTNEYNKFDIISISLGLFALTLTKDIAPVFSFIVFLFVLFDIIILQKKYKLLKIKNKNNIKKFLAQSKPVFIFLLVIIFSYLSWKINVILNTSDLVTSNPSSIKDVVKALLNIGGTYRVNVVNNYIEKLSNYKLTSMGNIYIFTSLMVLFSILLYSREKESTKKKFICGFSDIFLGEIIYIILMLVLYLLMFSEHEAVHLLSFDRYMGIYLTAILYFIVLITIYRSIENNNCRYLLVLLMIIILNSNMSSIFLNTYNFRGNKQSTQNVRSTYTKSVDSIRNKIDTNKKYKFYVIVQGTKGFEKWVLRYEMRDILKGINEGYNWSLGEKYNDEDIWTLDITKEKFRKILFDENYDYVYLYIIDDKFINRYSSLFDKKNIENGDLYRVDKNKKTLEFVK